MAVGKESVERAARSGAGRGRKKSAQQGEAAPAVDEKEQDAGAVIQPEKEAAGSEPETGAASSGKRKGVIGIGDDMPICYY